MNNRRRKTYNIFRAVGVVITILTTAPVFAGTEQQQGFTLSPMVGFLVYDQDSNLVDSSTASLAAGYRLNETWAVELAYLISEPGIEDSDNKIDLNQQRIDALYHFGQDNGVQPYLVFGWGELELETDTLKTEESMVNAGLGLKYALSNGLSLRSDVRAIRTNEETKTSDLAFNLGLHYLFGAKASPKPAKSLDSDGDGVRDKLDACPNSPSRTKVDATGCALKSDRDGDGVLDTLDACPNTPANAKVNDKGCVVNLDLDNDGIPNAKDACPDTKAGAKVDAKGCYIVLQEDVSVSLNVSFANNSDTVTSTSFADVEKLASFMREFPLAKVTIKGYTDSRGAAEYNQQLSQKRANAVAKIVVERFGVEANRVNAVGYGEENPIASNETAEGRAKNRRVEAVVSATVSKIAE